jgi:rhodanese-related sulfurtransferase
MGLVSSAGCCAAAVPAGLFPGEKKRTSRRHWTERRFVASSCVENSLIDQIRTTKVNTVERVMIMKKLLLVCAATMFAVAVYAGHFPEIKISELKSAIDARNVTLIDVNGTDSWKEGHIPGAIDFAAAKDKLAKVLPKDKNALVVAYCGGPKCQAYEAAAKVAKDLGYKNVKHLVAGISGWREAGEKVEKGS